MGASERDRFGVMSIEAFEDEVCVVVTASSWLLPLGGPPPLPVPPPRPLPCSCDVFFVTFYFEFFLPLLDVVDVGIMLKRTFFMAPPPYVLLLF